MPLLIESIGAEDCTALSLVKIGFSQTKNNYNVDMLWNLVPKSVLGANPIDTIHTAINVGLFNLTTHLFDKIWTNWFDATIGKNTDAFSNACDNMDVAQSSAQINGQWYAEWNVLQPNEVMPLGQTVVSNHSFVFVDYVTLNGVRMAKIDSHQGYDLYMPPDVFNAEVLKDEVGCLIPTNPTINQRRQVSLTSWITELLQQVILLFAKL